MTDVATLWSYLAATPLTWLTLTVVCYLCAAKLSEVLGHTPLANPVLWSVIGVAALLTLTGEDYPTYFEGAQFIHFLLDPFNFCLFCVELLLVLAA